MTTKGLSRVIAALSFIFFAETATAIMEVIIVKFGYSNFGKMTTAWYVGVIPALLAGICTFVTVRWYERDGFYDGIETVSAIGSFPRRS